uniref:t-SNARE coiled-coil homology domain-containing protein n=1 Tax=Oryzias latipes TaxID=8090 RepID=A0A3P9GXB7_ORYLA
MTGLHLESRWREETPQQSIKDECDTRGAESTDKIMEDCFKTVGDVKRLIEKMSSHVEEMEVVHGAILSSTNQDQKLKEELELLNNEITQNAGLVRTKLKSMQKSWLKEKTGVSVIHRIYENQHSHLTRCFDEVMRRHHQAQICFRDKCKAQIQRQLEIVDKATSNEELEEMLHCHDLDIFIADVNSETRVSGRALNQIERRHQDILSLESSIEELREIFADTAMLLESQGELINNIERNVTSAAEYVVESKEEMDKAITYKKNRFQVVSLPSFFRPFRKRSSTKTRTEPNPSDLNHNWTSELEGSNQD